MSDYKNMRDKYKHQKSKEKLVALCARRITTTMIGAISDIENTLADLLKTNPELYDQIRVSILDRGNAQIRNLKADLGDYDIIYNKTSIDHDTNIFFPIKNKEDNNGT